MSDLDPIVTVNITSQPIPVDALGFGGMVFLGYHTKFPERFRTYSALAELTADGFETHSPQYRALARAKANGMRELVIGRLPAAHTDTKKVTVTSAVSGQKIKLKVIDPSNGTVSQIERTIPGSSSLAAEATAVAALIDALTGVVASASSAVVTVTPSVAGRVVYVYDLENCTLEDATADAGYDDELAALALTEASFYWVTIDTASAANIAAVAAWTAANDRMFAAASHDYALLDGSSALGSDLKAASNARVFPFYALNQHEVPAVGVASFGSVKVPGSFTFFGKTPIGVTGVRLTTTQRNNLEADNVGHVSIIRNKTLFREGKVSSGEWIDIVHGTDAFRSALQEAVFNLLTGADKVDYDDGGRVQLECALQGPADRFEASRLLRADSTVFSLPAVDDQSATDRGNRHFPDIKFTSIYRGAIQSAGVEGNISI